MGLKARTPQPLRRSVKRLPLKFVQPAPDPLKGLPESRSPEKALGNELRAVKTGIQQRLERDQERRRAAGDADDHFVMVFETGAQARAFLLGIGYQWPDEAFIDGTIVADILGIELPKAEHKARELKKIHDPSLTRLVNRKVK